MAPGAGADGAFLRRNLEYHCKYDELVAPSELKDNPRNANRHPKKQLSALVNFIRYSGWRHPVVVSKRSGLIVAGHARKIAALELRCDCPVVYQDFESDEAERTFLHADNKLAELAELDLVALDLEVFELAALAVPVFDFGFELSDQKSDEPGKIETVKSRPYNEMLISVTTTFETWELKLKDIFSDLEKIESVKIVYGGKD